MNRHRFIVWLIFIVFFVISFLTNVLGPIIPDMITGFHINVALAGFLPFSFFVAYGLMSVPAGLLVEKYGEKKLLICSFGMAFIGALSFALWPSFAVGILSLFVIGSGMAILQVAINPLLRTAGGESDFAFNSVLAQLFFGAASFLSPQAYSYLVTHLFNNELHNPFWLRYLEGIVPMHMSWVSLYWIFAVVSIAMVLFIACIPFPQVKLKENEKVEIGQPLRYLLANRKVWLFFFGIFAYVGTEQGIASWISSFLLQYHEVEPATLGAQVNAYFWGLLTIGCLLGLLLLKFFDSRKILIGFTLGAMLCVGFALFGTREFSLYGFAFSGFFLSVMYSIIFSLALNSIEKYHGTFSGILCSGIAGGAIWPLIIGTLGNYWGLRMGLLCLFISLGYILAIGFWANPLIKNRTR